MNYYIDERALDMASFIVENKTTVRATANKFKISKSTVHKDLTERLPMLNFTLYKKVRNVLNLNLDERAVRGGQATKEKYKRKEAS